MLGLLQTVFGLPKDVAVPATVIIRLCTLWFATAIGFTILFAFRHRFGPVEDLEEEEKAALAELEEEVSHP